MKTKSVCWRLCATIIFACVCLDHSVGQQDVKCKQQHETTDVAEYRVGRQWRDKTSQILFVQISVDPKNFSRDGMKAVAQKLNRDFQDEPQLEIAICDDYDLAKSPELLLDLERRERVLGLRGFYELDRASGKEFIRFSTERGKSWNEMIIDLGKSR